MSDYDAIFKRVSGQEKPAASPYDDVMSSLMKKRAPMDAGPNAPAVVQAGTALNNATGGFMNLVQDVPRQLGLTARYGIEGLGQAFQVGSEPIRYVTDRLLGLTGKTAPAGVLASRFADNLGLPSPKNETERVVADATRLMAGAGGTAGLASRLGGAATQALQFTGSTPVAQSITQKTAQALAANPGQQVGAALGSGLAGGSAREAGGDELQQGLAALAGGVVGGVALPAAGDAVSRAIGAAKNFAKRQVAPVTPQQLDATISMTLERAGYDYSQIPDNVRRTLRADVEQALRTGESLDPVALSRLADFRRVGATPTRGMISQDPVQITKEMNLAKTGANTGDDGLQGLARVQNRNNSTFISNLNDQGAARGDINRAGQTVTDTIAMRRADLRASENAAWDAARNSPGYRQPVSASVISDINRALGESDMMPFMDPKISRYMEAFLDGQQPFTPAAYRNLQSMLSNEMQKGGNEAAAAGIARRVLENSELRPITNPRGIDFGNAVVTPQTAARLRAFDAQPSEAIDAVNQARRATRAAYAYEESSPLVRSVLSDGAASDPARIANRFVIGGTPSEAATLARELGPENSAPIRDAIVAHLKKMSLNGSADEVGKFSQSEYNKALNAIGPQKLALFFTPEEITQLRSLGRVASLAMNQPVGSAVNNSNSGTYIAGKVIDALAGLAAVGNATPLVGPWVTQPLTNGVRNLNIAIQTRAAENVAPGLLSRYRPPAPQYPPGASMLIPGAVYGGSLLLPPP